MYERERAKIDSQRVVTGTWNVLHGIDAIMYEHARYTPLDKLIPGTNIEVIEAHIVKNCSTFW